MSQNPRGLGGRQQDERALLRTEKVADAVRVGLDRHGKQVAALVLVEVDNAVPLAVVPDRSADLDRLLGIAKLLRPVRKTHDERWHGGAAYTSRG